MWMCGVDGVVELKESLFASLATTKSNHLNKSSNLSMIDLLALLHSSFYFEPIVCTNSIPLTTSTFQQPKSQYLTTSASVRGEHFGVSRHVNIRIRLRRDPVQRMYLSAYLYTKRVFQGFHVVQLARVSGHANRVPQWGQGLRKGRQGA
jgi:hypothetical protein